MQRHVARRVAQSLTFTYPRASRVGGTDMSPTPIPIADAPPLSGRLTGYDRAHRTVYIRLLDAETQGLSWEEAASVVLGLDPAAAPDRARAVHAAHLARARWMTTTGYRELAGEPPEEPAGKT